MTSKPVFANEDLSTGLLIPQKRKISSPTLHGDLAPPIPAMTRTPPGLTREPTWDNALEKDSWSVVAISRQLQYITASKVSGCAWGNTLPRRASQGITLRMSRRVRSKIVATPCFARCRCHSDNQQRDFAQTFNVKTYHCMLQND